MDDFRFGFGAPWLDLLATQRMRRQPPEVELLTNPAALRRWLRHEDLEPAVAPDADDLVAARRLREALYLLARAHLDGSPAPRGAVAEVNAALDGTDSLRLTAGSNGLASSRPPDSASALARLARDAVRELTGAAAQRLRACGDETCGGIFLDESGRRRWCSDARCGSRARVRAHRARVRGQ